MTRSELVARARSAVGHGTLYRLGAGAPHTAPSPWDETGSCDCSGFVCWALGISRYQPLFAFLQRLNGGWMNTDGMVADATQPTGYFTFVDQIPARPGDLVIYPSHHYAREAYSRFRPFGPNTPRIGHVGIVTGPSSVIHCSAGNYQGPAGDSIQETEPRAFTSVSYTRFIRFTGIE